MTRKVMFASVIAVLWAAAPATAVERWAAPAGSGTACTESTPCSLATATDYLFLFAGDEIIVKPGDYSIPGIQFTTPGIELHGQDGQPRPTITTSDSFGVNFFSAGRLRDLNLVSTSFTAFSMFDPGTVVERVTATASVAGAIPCQVTTTATIRDTVCRASGANTAGIGVTGGALSGLHTVKLRNVTAVGQAYGANFDISGSGVDFDIDAKNVIASATGPSGVDAAATAQGGASVELTLANSNYATEQQGLVSPSTFVNVTNPGSGTNQTAEPLFVNAAGGDFHQAAGSPTIDAGVLDADVGTNDFEGDERTLEGNGSCPPAPIPDIGADERAGAIDCTTPPGPPNPPAGGDTDPPETSFSKAPKKKVKSKRKKAKIKASFAADEAATFECSIDGKDFSACGATLSFKAATGKHTLEVRAVDSAGNVDPTPATASFKVKRKQGR